MEGRRVKVREQYQPGPEPEGRSLPAPQ
jgi:hypothetical protein